MDEYSKRGKIYQLQEWLLVLSRATGARRVIPDGIYGDETRAAVAEFQELCGLEVTGIVDLATWDALYAAKLEAERRAMPPEPITPFDTLLEGGVIRRGDVFPTVYILQAMLEELSTLYSYDGGGLLTGVFDEATELAVLEVQRGLELEESGMVDMATWNELALLYNRSLKYPQ